MQDTETYLNSDNALDDLMRFHPFNKLGFSLIELMVVIAIIAVLSTIAIGKMRLYSFNAKQSEAKFNLKHAYTLVRSYGAERNCFLAGTCGPGVEYHREAYVQTCSNTNPFGFRVTSCDKLNYYYMFKVSRYSFDILATEGVNSSGAKLLLPKCSDKWDRWTTNENAVLTNVGVAMNFPSLDYFDGFGFIESATQVRDDCL